MLHWNWKYRLQKSELIYWIPINDSEGIIISNSKYTFDSQQWRDPINDRIPATRSHSKALHLNQKHRGCSFHIFRKYQCEILTCITLWYHQLYWILSHKNFETRFILHWDLFPFYNFKHQLINIRFYWRLIRF